MLTRVWILKLNTALTRVSNIVNVYKLYNNVQVDRLWMTLYRNTSKTLIFRLYSSNSINRYNYTCEEIG